MRPLQIRVLYFAGCPHSGPTLELVGRIVSERGVAGVIEAVEVRSQEEARRLGFLGSPTVLVNGVDIDPRAVGRTDFGMACRSYGASGMPPASLIAAAVSRPRDAIA